jgi:hypothetical protein
VSISDAELARARGTGSYRAALWLTRLTALVALVLGAARVAVLSSASLPKIPMPGLVLLIPFQLVCKRVLLRHAGMPVTPGLMGDIADTAARKQWARDLRWYRRP